MITLSVHVCYRNGVQVECDWREWSRGRTEKHLMTQREDDKYARELHVYRVTADDAGTYRCVASNVAGSAECQAQVTVGGKLVEQQQQQ